MRRQRSDGMFCRRQLFALPSHDPLSAAPVLVMSEQYMVAPKLVAVRNIRCYVVFAVGRHDESMVSAVDLMSLYMARALRVAVALCRRVLAA